MSLIPRRPAVWMKLEQSSRIMMWEDDYSLYDNDSYFDDYTPEYSDQDESEDHPYPSLRNVSYSDFANKQRIASSAAEKAAQSRKSFNQRYEDWSRRANPYAPRMTEASKRAIHNNEFIHSSAWSF